MNEAETRNALTRILGDPELIHGLIAKGWASDVLRLYAIRQLAEGATSVMHRRVLEELEDEGAGVAPLLRAIFEGKIPPIEGVYYDSLLRSVAPAWRRVGHAATRHRVADTLQLPI